MSVMIKKVLKNFRSDTKILTTFNGLSFFSKIGTTDF